MHHFDSEWEGIWQRIPATTNAALATYDVDAVIRYGMTLLRDPDDIPARYGVLSFHHGDPAVPGAAGRLLRSADKRRPRRGHRAATQQRPRRGGRACIRRRPGPSALLSPHPRYGLLREKRWRLAWSADVDPTIVHGEAALQIEQEVVAPSGYVPR